MLPFVERTRHALTNVQEALLNPSEPGGVRTFGRLDIDMTTPIYQVAFR